MKFLKKFRCPFGSTKIWHGLILNALTWQSDLKWKKLRDENLPHLLLSSHKCRISHFFLSFSSSPSLWPCPVSVTGAVEGSQSVKEAHRGLMRTVLPKRVSQSGTVSFFFFFFFQHLCGCVCMCMVTRISLCARLEVWMCVRSVLVSTPHSLIKGREKPLKERLNLKG